VPLTGANTTSRLREHVGYLNHHVGRLQQPYRLTALEDALAPERGVCGVAVNLDASRDHIDDPVLRHALLGIEAELGVAIVRKRRLRYFNDQLPDAGLN
jgi:hypothetical protein